MWTSSELSALFERGSIMKLFEVPNMNPSDVLGPTYRYLPRQEPRCTGMLVFYPTPGVLPWNMYPRETM
jgi:hypothetical protein